MRVTNQAVTVAFDNLREATKFLAWYHTFSGDEVYKACDVGADGYDYPTCEAAAREALRLLADYHNVRELIGTPTTTPLPTYISGSGTGKVHDLRTMPTRYIRNVLNMTSYRMVRGLDRELRAELARRGESE